MKLTTDRHEASRSLSVTELLVRVIAHHLIFVKSVGDPAGLRTADHSDIVPPTTLHCITGRAVSTHPCQLCGTVFCPDWWTLTLVGRSLRLVSKHGFLSVDASENSVKETMLYKSTF